MMIMMLATKSLLLCTCIGSPIFCMRNLLFRTPGGFRIELTSYLGLGQKYQISNLSITESVL